MTISAIVAMGANGVIGQGGALPWKLPAEMSLFRRHTMGHHIIVGRKTAESLGRPLAERVNMVLSRQPCPQLTALGFKVYHRLEHAVAAADHAGERELFVIGGADVYRESFPLWHRLYLSLIEGDFSGGCFFPWATRDEGLEKKLCRRGEDVPLLDWQLQSEDYFPRDARNRYGFYHQIWFREGADLALPSLC